MNRTAARPLVPSDLPTDRILVRAATAIAVAASRGAGSRAEQIAKEWWPRDPATLELITRSATAPATTTQSGWAAELAAVGVGSFLASLQGSAAAALFQAAPSFDLSGRVRINLPRAPSTGTPRWVGEGQPIPVGQAVITNVQLGPPTKLAIIEAITNEVRDYSQPAAEAVVGQVLQDAARLALDAALYSATAGSAINPAGLLAGVTATPATTATDGFTAALSDARTLVDAVVAGRGGQRIQFFASPGRALALKGYLPDIEVFGSASIASGVLICLDAAAFASGFDSAPEIRASREPLLHFEDAVPAQIGTVGTPNIVAAPSRSVFQTDSVAIRMILRCSWVMRQPAVAFIGTGMTW